MHAMQQSNAAFKCNKQMHTHDPVLLVVNAVTRVSYSQRGSDTKVVGTGFLRILISIQMALKYTSPRNTVS